MPQLYPLFMFDDGRYYHITRGSTQELAMSYITQTHDVRGQTIRPVNWLPINAAEIYASNHTPGWLHRKPEYQRRAEIRQLLARVRTEGHSQVTQSLVQEAIQELRNRFQRTANEVPTSQ